MYLAHGRRSVASSGKDPLRDEERSDWEALMSGAYQVPGIRQASVPLRARHEGIKNPHEYFARAAVEVRMTRKLLLAAAAIAAFVALPTNSEARDHRRHHHGHRHHYGHHHGHSRVYYAAPRYRTTYVRYSSPYYYADPYCAPGYTYSRHYYSRPVYVSHSRHRHHHHHGIRGLIHRIFR